MKHYMFSATRIICIAAALTTAISIAAPASANAVTSSHGTTIKTTDSSDWRNGLRNAFGGARDSVRSAVSTITDELRNEVDERIPQSAKDVWFLLKEETIPTNKPSPTSTSPIMPYPDIPEDADYAAIPLASRSFSGRSYQDVTTALRNAGFTNVVAIPLRDLTTGWLSTLLNGDREPGDVKMVNVSGNTSFQVGAIFPKNARIVVSYSSNSDETAPIISIPIPGSSTSFRGDWYGNVESLLRNAGFTNIITNPDYGSYGWSGDVISVRIRDNSCGFSFGCNSLPSFRRGELFPSDTQIIIDYSEYFDE